jgi:hypothetical protein
MGTLHLVNDGNDRLREPCFTMCSVVRFIAISPPRADRAYLLP